MAKEHGASAPEVRFFLPAQKCTPAAKAAMLHTSGTAEAVPLTQHLYSATFL